MAPHAKDSKHVNKLSGTDLIHGDDGLHAIVVLVSLELGEVTGDETPGAFATRQPLVDQVRDPRRKDKNERVPMIMISSGLNQEIAARLKGKVQGAIVKPFSPEDLLSKVKQFDNFGDTLTAKPLNS